MAKIATKPLKVRCPHCPRPNWFTRDSDFARHLNGSHTILKRHLCPVPGCEYWGPNRHNTVRHMKSLHPDTPPIPIFVDQASLLAERDAERAASASANGGSSASASSSRSGSSASASVSAGASSSRVTLDVPQTASASAPATRRGTPAPLPRNASAPSARAARASPYHQGYAHRVETQAQRHSAPNVAGAAQAHPLARAVSYPNPDPVQADDLFAQYPQQQQQQQQGEMNPYTAMALQRTAESALFGGYNWQDAAALPAQQPGPAYQQNYAPQLPGIQQAQVAAAVPPPIAVAPVQQPELAYQYNYAPPPQAQLPGTHQAQVAATIPPQIAVPAVQQQDPVYQYNYAPTQSAPQMPWPLPGIQQAQVSAAVPPPALAQQYYYAPAESMPQQPRPGPSQQARAPLDISGLPHWAYSAGGVSQQPAGGHVPQAAATSPVARIARRRPVSSSAHGAARRSPRLVQPAVSAPVSVSQPAPSAPSSSSSSSSSSNVPPPESLPSSSALPASSPGGIVQPASSPSDTVQPELTTSDIIQFSSSLESAAELLSSIDFSADVSQWSPETLAEFQEIATNGLPDLEEYLQSFDSPSAT